MHDDLTDILKRWPFERGPTMVRQIHAQDGRPLLQIRVGLGVLQMEMTGRPDGVRPHGATSVLDWHLNRLPTGGSEDEAQLTHEECRDLREEAMLFHHRSVAAMSVGRFDAVLDDAAHMLRIVDLCHDCSEEEDDRHALERLRPGLIAAVARAAAELALADHDTSAAMSALDEGLRRLESLLGPEALADSNEAALLQGMRDLLVPKLPSSQRAELQHRLDEALEQENYELAAILRDELRVME